MSDSDEEYGPITASWGTQAPVEPAEPAKPEGWDSLVDPNVKVGPNDVGSGNLHRRGTNYKPIKEDLILAQRKKIAIPKKIMMEAIRETEASLGLPESKEKPRKAKPKKKPGKPTVDRFSHSKPHTPVNYIPPPPSTTRPPPPASNGVASSWLNTNLVDTPFWEQKSNAAKPLTKNAVNRSANTTNWAAAVNEVVSDPHDNTERSPTEWMTSNQADKPYNSEKPKPAVPVTWGSNNEAENTINGSWGTFNKQDQYENKWGYVQAGGSDANPPPTTSNGEYISTQPQPPPQPEPKLPNRPEWLSTSNDWRTPAARREAAPTPAPVPAAASNNQDWGAVSHAANNNEWTGSLNAATHTITTSNTFTSNNSSGGWGEPNTQNNGSWGVANEATTWGSTDTTSTYSNNSNDQHIPSDKPSWLNSIPDKGSQPQSSRFSNPYKQRYSEVPIDIPEPVNYRREGLITPLRTAPPPPPENSLLITIKVELSDTIKVSVDLRELDDPYKLAVDFGIKNNVNAPKVIEALTKLFTTQKELGLKKKNQKLQRRVHPKNYDNVYSNYNNNNQLTAPPSTNKFSTYSRPSSAAPSPAPFARKVYY